MRMRRNDLTSEEENSELGEVKQIKTSYFHSFKIYYMNMNRNSNVSI